MASQLKAFVNQHIQSRIPGASRATNYVLSLMPDFRNGCAIINLESEDLLQIALKLDGAPFRKVRLTATECDGSEAQSGSNESNQRSLASQVICFLGTLSRRDLCNDEVYFSAKEDIETECASHGNVVSVIIPRPGDSLYTGISQIFVEFCISVTRF
eukprot:TRINITY_DN3516_c0_g1_i1.p1 TRINITY_DN3516_c0_g1~~TRINITY_DN3516_c0_g1_i1.p1  ORF type:complete len:178 (+),score=20.94 TRINITY_DN3516_c0_g1_i1:66-536(+)